MSKLFDFLVAHYKGISALLISIIGLVIPFYQFITQKWLEEKDKRFTRYHHLIDELANLNDDKPISLNRQMAIIYELRQFQTYRPVTKRILEQFNESWSKPEELREKRKRLLNELEIAIKYIEYKNSNWLRRFWIWITLRRPQR